MITNIVISAQVSGRTWFVSVGATHLLPTELPRTGAGRRRYEEFVKFKVPAPTETVDNLIVLEALLAAFFKHGRPPGQTAQNGRPTMVEAGEKSVERWATLQSGPPPTGQSPNEVRAE